MSEIERLNMIAAWQEQHKQLIEDLDNSKKRIKELEQKLEQTEKALADYQFNYPSIKKLSEENAELKKELSENKVADCEIVNGLCEQLTKAKEIIRSLYFVIQGRIDYEGNIQLEDEMYRAKQFIKE